MQKTLSVSILSALFIYFLIASKSVAANNSSEFETILQTAYPGDGPGATAIIVQEDEALFRGAYGMADIELGVAMTPGHILRVGSLTKQFTAAAIMLLSEQGKLSLDDPLSKYLPDYPTHGHRITIEHLLAHTSGIFNYTSLPTFFSDNADKDISTEALIAKFENAPMDFAPGDATNYSNSAFVLLGAIIEKISGQSYAEFMQDNIFSPLNLTNTRIGSSGIIYGRAEGYERTPDGGYKNATPLSMTQAHAAGAIISTVDDLARWHAALTGGELLDESSYQRMITPFVLNSGEPGPFGYGFRIGTVRGQQVIQHSGSINGFSSFALWLPEQEIYIALLTNRIRMTPSPQTVATKLAAVALNDPFPEWSETEIAAEKLTSYAGTYCQENGEKFIASTGEDGGMTIKTGPATLPFKPANDDTFFMENSLTYLTFQAGSGGRVKSLRFHPNGTETPLNAERCG